jgi:hypothetical protein
MKKLTNTVVAVFSFLVVFGSPVAFAGDLESLSGKWSVKKTNDNGQSYTQTVSFKKDKFTFKIAGSDAKTYLYAEGDVKVEKLGPFKSIKFTNIKAGKSADELEAVEDDRNCIYKLEEGSFTLASNLDKDREKGPVLEVYTKADK